MAKKPSSKAKNKNRAVDQSAVKGGGIMSINKSNTSTGMKIVIIILIVAFVLLFSYGGIAGFVDLFSNKNQVANTPTVDPVTAIKNQFDSRISAFDNALASAPTSYTLLVNSANAHFDYAQQLSKASQTATAAMAPAIEQWSLARDAFAKAVKVRKPLENSVGVDYSITLFYSGDTTSAIKAAVAVRQADPNYAPAYYNLGIFYQAARNPTFAIAAFQRYLALDPKGTIGSPDYARQQLQSLGASATPSGGPATTTP